MLTKARLLALLASRRANPWLGCKRLNKCNHMLVCKINAVPRVADAEVVDVIGTGTCGIRWTFQRCREKLQTDRSAECCAPSADRHTGPHLQKLPKQPCPERSARPWRKRRLRSGKVTYPLPHPPPFRKHVFGPAICLRIGQQVVLVRSARLTMSPHRHRERRSAPALHQHGREPCALKSRACGIAHHRTTRAACDDAHDLLLRRSGLFDWSMKYQDGTQPTGSGAKAVSPEDAAWCVRRSG